MIYFVILIFQGSCQNQEFFCRNGGQSILFSQFNDGKCDCCDGSDEFLNSGIFCPNNCEISLPKKTISLFRILYDQSIKLRHSLSAQSHSIFQQSRSQFQNLENTLNQLSLNQNHLQTSLDEKLSSLKSWAYKLLDIKQPTNQELQEQKIQYINRRKYLPLKTQNLFDEEEENIGFEQDEIDETIFEKRRKDREIKWDDQQQLNWNHTLDLALKKSKNHSLFNEFQSFQANLNDLIDRISKTKIEQRNYKFDLEEDGTSDFVWITKKSEELSILVGEDDVFYFSFGKFATFKKGNQTILLGLPTSIRNNRFNFDGKFSSRYRIPWSASISFFCYSQTVFFDAFYVSASKIFVVGGAPEACSLDKSDGEFILNLRGLQFQSHKIFRV